MEGTPKTVRSFVIRAARTSDSQKKAISELSSLYALPFPPALNVEKIFPDYSRRVVEIGFGNGDATLEIAEKLPQTAFLGIEVHPPGVGRVLKEIHARQLSNLRVVQYDAVEVVESFSNASIDGYHVFFPDPWPKKRHHKRRLLQTPFLLEIVRTLKVGGYFYFASDWEEYCIEVKEALCAISSLKNAYTDWAEGIEWRPRTKFEQRGILEQRPIREVYFTKVEER